MNIRLLTVLVAFCSLGSGYAAAVDAAGSDPAGQLLTLDASKLKLLSANALVLDATAGTPIYAKGADAITPIASVTKLMTAMVVLDAAQPMDETISVSIADIDLLKGSSSRLRMGTELSRREMLRLALMASENRAASSLARHYPGGKEAFVEAMNRKAQSLGMTHTHFSDPTGLTSENVATANDLAVMVQAAATYPVIREFTTTPSLFVEMQPTGRVLGFNNTNSLVKSGQWDILLSKTGFIREAGKCLVMLANIASRPVVIVLLDSYGKLTRIGDANRVKYWLETGESMPAQAVVHRHAVPAKRPVKGTIMPKLAKNGKARTKVRPA